jgi:hypothetical protein
MGTVTGVPRLGMNAFPRKRLVKACTSRSG